MCDRRVPSLSENGRYFPASRLITRVKCYAFPSTRKESAGQRPIPWERTDLSKWRFRVRCIISRSRFPRASFNLVAAGLLFSPPSINPFRKIPFAMPVLRAKFVAATLRGIAFRFLSASHTLKPLLRKKRRTLAESRGADDRFHRENSTAHSHC